MEFNEKLQELRKSRGMTQEDLAEALYVSRAAVSKWESGRGYPSIDSLKDISVFFSVSIDDLLSGEKLISIAEKENESSIRSVCSLMFGVADLFSVLLLILPLYPKTVNGYVYSVNLFEFMHSIKGGYIYLGVFVLLVIFGALKLICVKANADKISRTVTGISFAVNVFAVILLGLSRQAYAVTVAFLILTVKGIILFKHTKAK